MEPVSIASMIWDMFNWVLKWFGKKIVNIDDYQTETCKIKHDYVDKSPACVNEKEQGATFYFSEYDIPDYERYFEVKGNLKKYFWNDSKQYLLIKRVKNKQFFG